MLKMNGEIATCSTVKMSRRDLAADIESAREALKGTMQARACHVVEEFMRENGRSHDRGDICSMSKATWMDRFGDSLPPSFVKLHNYIPFGKVMFFNRFSKAING